MKKATGTILSYYTNPGHGLNLHSASFRNLRKYRVFWQDEQGFEQDSCITESDRTYFSNSNKTDFINIYLNYIIKQNKI
jgi:uncharacterized protein YcfL